MLLEEWLKSNVATPIDSCKRRSAKSADVVTMQRKRLHSVIQDRICGIPAYHARTTLVSPFVEVHVHCCQLGHLMNVVSFYVRPSLTLRDFIAIYISLHLPIKRTVSQLLKQKEQMA